MKRVVEEQRLGFIATVCPDGTPNLSPKGTTAVWDDEHLVFANIRSPGTLANLRHNPSIEVNVVDPFLRKGYRFKGAATVLESGPDYDKAIAFYEARGSRVSVIREVVLIRVESAQPVDSPAYDAGLTEDDVRDRWERHYDVLRATRSAAQPAVPIDIREERSTDRAAIRAVNTRAFDRAREAHIVDALRSSGNVLLSLVAEVDDQVVGHILYSPVSLAHLTGAALGPVAVLPEHQRHGIGSALIEHGNRRLKESGCPFVVVVGHAAYYRRFGFMPARAQGLACEWNVPDEVFMCLTLDAATMDGIEGLAKYRDEFSSVRE